jgi:hypothetical protein
VTLVVDRFTRIDPDARLVVAEGGTALPYDFLVIATGSRNSRRMCRGWTTSTAAGSSSASAACPTAARRRRRGTIARRIYIPAPPFAISTALRCWPT